MSPQLDSSLFFQAVARCHRIGQTKQVKVVTMATKDTLEETALPILKKDYQPKNVEGEVGGIQYNQIVLKRDAIFEKVIGEEA